MPRGPKTSKRVAFLGLYDDEQSAMKAVLIRSLGLARVTLRWRNDHETVLAAVRRDGRQLRWASDRLKSEFQIVFAAVVKHGPALAHALPEMRDNATIASAAVQSSVKALPFVGDALLRDRDFVLQLATARKRPDEFEAARAHKLDFYKRLPETLKRDEAVVTRLMSDHPLLASELIKLAEMQDCKYVMIEAVCLRGSMLELASDRLRNDRDLVLWAVKTPLPIGESRSCALQHASEALRDDEAVVLKAMSTDRRSFAFASHRLRTSDKMILHAIRYDADAFLTFSSEELQSSKEFVLKAVDSNARVYARLLRVDSPFVRDRDVVMRALACRLGSQIEFVPYPILSDHDVGLHVARTYGCCLSWTPFQIAHGSNVEILMAAVQQNGKALRFVEQARISAEAYRTIALAAARQNGFAYFWLSVWDDRELVLAAVAQSGLVLEHVREPFRSDRDVCRAAVASNPAAISFVPASLKRDIEFRLLASSTPEAARKCIAAARKKRKETLMQKNAESYEAFLRSAEEAPHRFPASAETDALFDDVASLLREAMDQERGFLGKRDRAAFEED